jgi:C4-dicarboxylate-specific signal transduction histidine kinase
LERYQKNMSRAEQLASVGALSATVAHELTQPLTVSRLSLQDAMTELETTNGSAKVMESLRECLQGICDAAGRIEHFRSFARQSPREAPREVRLHDVVTRTIRLLDGKARERRMSLAARGVSALPPIHANERDLEQMCFALVENAIQAADGAKQRKLVISGDQGDGRVTLRFEDNCGGIAPEHVDKIFQPFFTTKPQGEGTGLGLCIVDRVVAHAAGTVRVENHPGQGAAFLVTLPLR